MADLGSLLGAAGIGGAIPWNEIREARCVCGVEGWHAPDAGHVRRNDPYDPATGRHLGQCEYVGETAVAMLRILLKVTDKGDYDWVESGDLSSHRNAREGSVGIRATLPGNGSAWLEDECHLD